MPAINGPANMWFYDQFAMIKRRLLDLETQQNHGCTDSNLKLRLRWGLQPDRTFGLWALDPTTGNPVMKLNGTMLELLNSSGAKLIDLTDTGLTLYDSAGHDLIDLTDTGMVLRDSSGHELIALTNAGLAAYDTSGHDLVKLDNTGQTVYNATGTEEVKLGAQSAGGYGLTVRNPTGVMQLVAGRAITTKPGPLTYNSTTYGTLTGGPSVSVTVPPSGNLDITIGAIITPGSDSAGESAFLAVFINQSSGPLPYLIVAAPANDPLPQTAFAEAEVTGLTAGTTATISTVAKVSTPGVTASFSQVTLTATPV